MARGSEDEFDLFGGAESKPDSGSRRREQVRAIRDRAIAEGRDRLHDSIESGQAEKLGHMGIDVTAKAAERSLRLLPPGTRMVGRFVGKRVIRHLKEEGHDRLGQALDQTGLDTAALGSTSEDLFGGVSKSSETLPTLPDSSADTDWFSDLQDPTPQDGDSSSSRVGRIRDRIKGMGRDKPVDEASTETVWGTGTGESLPPLPDLFADTSSSGDLLAGLDSSAPPESRADRAKDRLRRMRPGKKDPEPPADDSSGGLVF